MAIILNDDEELTYQELTYQEQLKTKEWKSRRQQILERDDHCCSFCGKGQCRKLKFDHNTFYLGIDSSKPSISSSDFTVIESGEKFKDAIKRLKLTHLKRGPIPLSDQVGVLSAEGAFFYTVWRTDEDYTVIKEEAFLASVICSDGYIANILYRDKDELDDIELKRVYVQDEELILAVHHKRYIVGRNAWEYDDDDLVTLCQDCHSKVHEFLPVQVYDENDDGSLEVMNLTPCYRCNGTGYLPEYSHVENGICFRCRGARFEELIADNTEYFDEL